MKRGLIYSFFTTDLYEFIKKFCMFKNALNNSVAEPTNFSSYDKTSKK